MSGRRVDKRSIRGWVLGLTMTMLLGLTPAVRAAEPSGDGPSMPPVPSTTQPSSDSGIQLTGCPSCGTAGGILGMHSPGIVQGDVGGGCADCGDDDCCCGGCCGGECYPGHKPCDCCGCFGNGVAGRLAGAFYQAVCCPDPCYEPRWVALTDSAFFVDSARPITQMRLRTDFGWNLQFPDRSEYYWARIGQKGPSAPNNQKIGETALDAQDLRYYTEGAIERFSFFIDMGFRHTQPEVFGGASGFSDMVIGTKSVLVDSEMILCTFQFKTFLPTGNAIKGLGTGHTSLEPSMLFALKLTPDLYLQGQLSYFFPLGGTDGLQGSVFHYHFALNQNLWKCGEGVKVIGTLGFNGYKFLNGAYTSPANSAITFPSNTVGDIFEVGPGARLVLCDKIDFGVGSSFSLTGDHLYRDIVRAEFRWRF